MIDLWEGGTGAINDFAMPDTLPDEQLDSVSRLARNFLGVDSVLITLVDRDGKPHRSPAGIRVVESSQRDAFFDYAIRQPDYLLVHDAREDPRFRESPQVASLPGIRFYAGLPLEVPGGGRIGVLSVSHSEPRDLSLAELAVVRDLAAWAQSELALLQELEQATQVQRGLLPKRMVGLPGFDVAGDCTTAKAVGGDFYDWYPIAQGAAFTLADVMGKGIGAAIIAATVRAVLRAGSRGHPLVEVVESAAAILESDLDEAGTFVTLFHARLNIITGVVHYVDAGHGLSLVVRADGSTQRLASTGFPLGVDPDESWPQDSVILGLGDTLVTVSDGVLDLFGGTLAALDDVEQIVREGRTAQAVVDEILGRAGRSALDDVTAVVVRREG